MRTRRAAALVVAVSALCGLSSPGGSVAASRFSYSTPRSLPESLPSAKAQRQGGEPSLIFDQGGKLVYAASPGAPDHGGNFWRSTNGGRTFGPGLSVGSQTGGGDSDLAVAFDKPHTVFNIDLEDLVASDLCRSTDHGRSFPSSGCSSGFATNQQQPASDRPWINTVPGHPNLLYGTYDGLAFGGGAPEVDRSNDQGQTSTKCGQVLEPGSDAFAHFSPTGALENSETIGKPAIGRDGTLYVPFTEPHQAGQQFTEPSDPTPDNLYVGIGRRGCPDASATFKDVTVYKNDTGTGSNFSNIFPSIAVDGGGTVYALAAGVLKQGQKGEGVYLFVSRSGGLHWSAPIKVNSGPPQAAVIPALAGGLYRGQALIGWYGSTTSTNHNSDSGRWKYYVAQTRDYGRTFTRTTVTRKIFHYGQVCTLGVECTGGRNLLDFTSVAVNPKTGCGMAIFGGDPYDTPGKANPDPAAAYTSIQQGGPCLAKPPKRHRRHHHPGRHGDPDRHHEDKRAR
jgi:hypothetical protein